LEEGAVRAVGARKLRDNENLFCVSEHWPDPEGVISNVAKVIDCVDLIVALVGQQDLTAEGPEA
jgi:hypothetical protein